MSDSLSQLNIMIWNSQCLKPKVNEFETFLSKFNIHIALISETWFTNLTKFGISNYECYRNDRPTSSNRSAHGGVAILINKSIPHSLLGPKITNCVENIFIEVETESAKIKIGAIYAPPSCKVAEFRQDFNKLVCPQSPFILGGDFNAKSTTWNNIISNRKGSALQSLCSGYNLSIMAPSGSTLIPCRGEPSVVDFFITKNCSIENPTVVNELSSDHCPVISSINFNCKPKSQKSPNYSKADWNHFREILDQCLSNKDLSCVTNADDVDEVVEFFDESVKLALKGSVPLKNIKTYRHPHSPEIERICQERNWNRRKFLISGQSQYKKEINRLNKIIKSMTSTLNINNWNSKLADLSVEDKSLYLITKNLKRKKNLIPPPENAR